jgi:hypothetical protein
LRTNAYGPRDDPDGDGFSNAREQAVGTDPAVSNGVLRIEMTEWQAGYWRLSWPGIEDRQYTLEFNTDLGLPFADAATAPGRFPVTEHLRIAPSGSTCFYRLRAPLELAG